MSFRVINIKEAKQSTPMRGPGERLKVIASRKPKNENRIPNPAERTIAKFKVGAWYKPKRAGAESKPITRTTPTAAIELTTTIAVTNPSANRNEGTFSPLEAAPSGSKPR